MTAHYAVLHSGERDLLDRLGGLLGRLGDLPVVLAGDPARASALTGLLAGRVVARLDRLDIHSRPAAALAVYRRHVTGSGAVVITEPDPGTEPADWLRATRLEAAVNLVDGPGAIICVYPADGPEPLCAAVAETHPHLLTAGGTAGNPRFADPAVTLTRLAPVTPLPPPPARPLLTLGDSAGITDLSPIRRQVGGLLAGVPTLVRTDFMAAVNEVLTNGYLHGTPPLGLTLWAGDDWIECRITDRGTGLDDPVAGYRPFDSATRAGAGLWLARQACDDLDMWHEGGVFTVRLATAATVGAGRRHAGALARAEAAQARSALYARRYL